MNILDKKSKEKELLTPESLHTALYLISLEYINRYLPEKSDVSLNDITKIDNSKRIMAEIRLKKLIDAGLGYSYNAKKLKNILGNGSSIRTSALKSEIDFIQQVKSLYSKSLIVPWLDFYRVLKKYGLVCSTLEDYEKIIPEENENELLIASQKFNSCGKNFNKFRIADRVRINSDNLRKKDLNFLIDFIGRLPFDDIIDRPSIYGFAPVLDDLFKNVTIVDRKGYDYNNKEKEWFIAAQEEDLENNVTIEVYSSKAEFKRKQLELMKNDPIIFKASQYGAVIVTMWDKEADDEIFDKYRG